MKNKFLLSAFGAMALAVAINACQEPSVNPSSNVPSQELATKPTVFIGATSLADCRTKRNVTYNLPSTQLNWVKANVYCLCGDVRVPSGSTLNIAAGTLVRGDSTSGASLVVTRGAAINAIGASNDPIIFTSADTVGQRQPMDWGGLIILGNAQINQGTAPIDIEGFPPANAATGTAAPPQYGSTGSGSNGESSGTLQYVRIEFGGIPLPGVANSEKNGLTLGGVGSGTTIDHVQVSSGADDGFEWFGGTVNAKYLISHKNLDDDFDTDFGYQGRVQYGVVSRDPARADISKSNGFESDNDADGIAPGPQTSAIFSNFTIIGPVQCSTAGVNANYNDGLHLRRNTGIDIYNTVVTGWTRYQYFTDASVVSSTVLTGDNVAVRPQPVPAPTIQETGGTSWSGVASNVAAAAANCTANNLTSIYRLSGLQPSAWTLNGVNFTPYADNAVLGYTSPLLAQGQNANLIDGFFSVNSTTAAGAGASTYFIGARRAADDNGWNVTSGWVNWQPETVSYDNDGQY